MSAGVRDSEDFRAGMAYAAHVLRHTIGEAHGGDARATVAQVEPRVCCQDSVLGFALGIAEGLEQGAGLVVVDEHEHRDGRS